MVEPGRCTEQPVIEGVSVAACASFEGRAGKLTVGEEGFKVATEAPLTAGHRPATAAWSMERVAAAELNTTDASVG